MVPRVLALNATSLAGHDAMEALPMAQRAGLVAIELTAGRSPGAMVKADMNGRALWALVAALDRHQLKALALGAHRDLSQPKEQEEFFSLLAQAEKLSCAIVTTAVPDGCDEQRYSRGLAMAVLRAREHHLTVCLENHGREHGTGRSLLPFVKESPDIRLCYDTGNAVFYGGADPVEDLASCAAYVSHLHLKDKGGHPDEWNFPAFGQGTVDFNRILAAEGWRGSVTASIEIEFTPGGVSLAETERAILQSVSYWTAISRETR
jgi:L-ribulose-5-phosphate 3-epimerase